MLGKRTAPLGECPDSGSFRTAPHRFRTAPRPGKMDSVTEHTDGPAGGTVRGAAARSAAHGEENAAAVLAELGARRTASAAEIARALGLSERRVRDHLYRLAEAGLVERSGSRWRATTQGTARAGPTVSAREVEATFDLLPSEAHRALARLARDAVVARWHLGAQVPNGWPAFALYGPPGGGKSTLARVIGRLFGIADHDHVYVVSDRSRADLLGRRVPDGRGGFRFAPAPSTGRPVVTLDELQAARGDAREAALRVLQGDSLVTFEGDRVVLRATPVVTFNAGADPRSVVPEDRLRRVVLLDVDGLASPQDCARAASPPRRSTPKMPRSPLAPTTSCASCARPRGAAPLRPFSPGGRETTGSAVGPWRQSCRSSRKARFRGTKPPSA